MARRKDSPEERAEWLRVKAEAAEARRRLEASLDRYDEQVRDWRERKERRRRLLRALVPFRRAG
jgi:hypothetical protein